MSSLRIAPSSAHPISTSNTTAGGSRTHNTSSQKPEAYPSAPSAPGLPDTLRAATNSSSSSTVSKPEVTSTHPLEPRLSGWRSNQESLQHTLLRRTHGIADPLRRSMELHLVRSSDSFRPSGLGQASRVHDDILSGRDTSLDWEDVYCDADGLRTLQARGGGENRTGVDGGWTGEMEGLVGMKKW